MTIAAIEAGGTKFVAGLLRIDGSGSAPPIVLARCEIPTTVPRETLAAVSSFFLKSAAEHGSPDSIGIGCFGPVDIKHASPTWGRITSTPKPGWKGADIAGYFQNALSAPVAFDTDVNAAAYGEYLWGGARGLRDFIYLTIGTGIGGGVFSNGSLVHGLSHPELGHLKLAREANDDYPGRCPYHHDCFEGLASGPAIADRWATNPKELGNDHPAWELEARYVARAIAAYSFVLSPERILIGGGIGMRPGLVERVRVLLVEELAGYLLPLTDSGKITHFVDRPALGSDAGLFGAGGIALRFSAE